MNPHDRTPDHRPEEDSCVNPHVPTPDQGLDEYDTVLVWAIGLVEPLIPLHRRLVADIDLLELFRRQPELAKIWCVGAIANLVRTLPPDDVYRNLSARVVVPGGGDLVREAVSMPPTSTGATTEGGRTFGTVSDGYDLAAPLFTRIGMDAALAALQDGLSPAAAATLAFCADGWQRGLQAIRALCDPAANSGDAAQFLFEAATSALKWVAHRRCTYLGRDDLYAVESCFMWVANAQLIADGAPSNENAVERSISQELVRGRLED